MWELLLAGGFTMLMGLILGFAMAVAIANSRRNSEED